MEHIRVLVDSSWLVAGNRCQKRCVEGYILRYMGSNDRAVGEATAALAAAICEVQRDRGLSTAKLSRESTIPYSTLRRIRAGERAIDWEQLTQLAKALNIGISDLAAKAENDRR